MWIRAFLAAWLLTACAGGVEVGRLGTYAAYRPHFTVPSQPSGSGSRAPTHVIADLASPGYVVMLYVVPGRGATLLYPIDSTTYNYMSAGSHDLPISFTGSSRLADTLLMRRPDPNAGRRTRAGGRGQGSAVDPRLLAASGYLLMLTSSAPLSFSAIAPKVDGVSLPIEDDEALNAIAKQVLSATDHTKPWAAYYQHIETR
jgi:hypothetical protein